MDRVCDTNNSSYPSSVPSSSVFVGVAVGGTIGNASEAKVTGVGVGKGVNKEDVEVASNTFRIQVHRYKFRRVTYLYCTPCDM